MSERVARVHDQAASVVQIAFAMFEHRKVGWIRDEQLIDIVVFEHGLDQVLLNCSKIEVRLCEDQTAFGIVRPFATILEQVVPDLPLHIEIVEVALRKGQQVKGAGEIFAIVDLVADEQATSFALHFGHTVRNVLDLVLVAERHFDRVAAIV